MKKVEKREIADEKKDEEINHKMNLQLKELQNSDGEYIGDQLLGLESAQILEAGEPLSQEGEILDVLLAQGF